MMDLTWFVLGLLTAGWIIHARLLWTRYQRDWRGVAVYGLGAALVFLCMAWGVGAVLEGVPRAGSMGLIFFGLPGLAVATFGLRYIRRGGLKNVAELSTETARGAAVRDESIASKRVAPAWGAPVRRILSYGAYASLLVAFIAGWLAPGKDYESLIRAHYSGDDLVKIKDAPPVFRAGVDARGGAGYVLIQEGQGYGGPFVFGIRIGEDRTIHEIIPLDDRETPAFIKKANDAHFLDQFKARDVTDPFIVGDDIDAVSGATVTTMAATEAVREGAHLAATQYFKLDRAWTAPGWKLGVGEVMVACLFGLALVLRGPRDRPLRVMYTLACIAVIGFYVNGSISIGSLSSLLLGYVPGVKDHLVWWILVVGAVAVILITGRNVYCYRMCPFYGIQYLLGRLSGNRWQPSPGILRASRALLHFLLWFALMAIFLSRLPAAGAYEPFAMMFSLEGVGIQWYILPLALIGSFFMSSFWCRFFCPTGLALTSLVKARQTFLSVVMRATPNRDRGGEDE
jgi:hypothetical protein